MRKLAVLFSLLVVALAFSGSAFAHNCSSVPYFVSPNSYEYEANDLTTYGDYDCWSPTTDLYWGYTSCLTYGVYTGSMYQHLRQTINVGASDSGTNSWTLTYKYDFSSSGGYWYDQISTTVTVLHSGQYYTYTTGHNGTQGSVACGTGTVNFTAYNGDTISVDIALHRSDPGASMGVTQVHIRRTAS